MGPAAAPIAGALGRGTGTSLGVHSVSLVELFAGVDPRPGAATVGALLRNGHIAAQDRSAESGPYMERSALVSVKLASPPEEDAMCHARDFRAFDVHSQKNAEDTRSAEERRAGAIDKLLRGASEKTEKAMPEPAPVKEAAPAK
jgi:hypothetical protein